MREKYKLTEEHKAQLKPWADKWIANGLSTKPMDDEDRAEMRKAIKGLYESANLTPPPDHRIVFVPSPFVARFAGGFAASILWKRKNGKDDATIAATDAATKAETFAATIAATIAATYDATDDETRPATTTATFDATRAATYAATDAATKAETFAATIAATIAATYDATDDETRPATTTATFDATRAATEDATDAATRPATTTATFDATFYATDDARELKKSEPVNKNWYGDISGYIQAGINMNVGKFGFECAAQSWRMYQGGNFWSGRTALLSFFRHVAKLPLDYSKFEHWEKATIHGSYRIMHPDFCMVSDRPRVLKRDHQGRPHCETGPYIQWADGIGLYAWHGVRIPEYWITHKHLLTPDVALNWDNAEQRRAACEILGWHNVLEHPSLNPKIIDHDEPHIGTLIQVDLKDAPKQWFIKYQCGTGRWFAEAVNDKRFDTAVKANAGKRGWRPEYKTPPEAFIPFIRS